MVRIVSVILLFILPLALPAVGADATSTDPAEIRLAMEKVYPALVRIFVVSARHAGGREVKGGGSGSGVIITPEGQVVTNHHVVGHAVRIWCTLANREQVDARLVGTDALSDIAVIQLLPETMRQPVTIFPAAAWGDSDRLQVGQRVFAMGSPGSLAQSVTSGIIANTGAVLPGGMVLDGEPVGTLVRWILHDAQIFGGNSGGPLVNAAGEVVGINEIGVAALGGAIPANTARQVAAEIMRHGFVDRSWIGISAQKLLQSDPKTEGMLVGGVTPGAPAAAAGLQPGDRILAVNDILVQVRFDEQMPEFHRIVLEAPIGATLAVRYRRDGNEQIAKIVTAARGQARSRDHEIQSWGITARDLTRLAVIAMRLDFTDGVMVSSLRPGGPAGQAKPALAPGDIIRTVGDREIRQVDELTEVSRVIANGQETGVPTMIGFWRNGEALATVVAIGPENEPQVVAETARAWFPAATQVLTQPLAQALGMAGTKGIRITRLYPQLQDTGFRVGDIITHLDLQPIDASEPQHEDRFPAMVRMYKPGTAANLKLIRDGETMVVAYQLPAAPKPNRELAHYKDQRFEFEARDLGVMDRIELRLAEDQPGAILASVTPGGWAQIGGLRNQDILLRIGSAEIRTVADLQNALAEIERQQPEHVVFFVKRGGATSFTEIRPDWTRSRK